MVSTDAAGEGKVKWNSFITGEWDEDPDCLLSCLWYLPARGDGNFIESLESGGSHLAFADVGGATDFFPLSVWPN